MVQWIDRSEAGKLALAGPDAYGCLQALLSADLAPVPVGGGSATALLAPRGQVRALARVLRASAAGCCSASARRWRGCSAASGAGGSAGR